MMRVSFVKAALVPGSAAAFILAFAGVSAKAATVTETFDVTASHFFEAYGGTATPPIDPVNLSFTITFATTSSGIPSPSSTGIYLNSANVMETAPFSYITNGSNLLYVGESSAFSGAGIPTVGNFAASLYYNPDGSTLAGQPVIVPYDYVIYATQDGSFLSESVSVTSTPAVPLPPTLPMFGAAVAGLAALAKRRRITA